MIKLSNVSKYYNSGANVVLGLRKINLEFNKGDFVAITGESGSGKSTLLNVISGLDSYEDGEIYFNGQPTSHYDQCDWEEYRKNSIGFIFQNYNLIDSYTVLENVLAALLIKGYEKSEAKIKARKIIAKVGLTDKEKNRASQLSSGQKQRLSIARALAKETDVLIADEPTGNLDVENGNQIIELLYEISKEKLVIMVTHNFDEVKDYATRKIRMYDGEVQSDIVLEKNLKNIGTKPEECDAKNEKKCTIKQINNKKTAWEFALLNIKSQPKKVILLFVFLLFTAFSSYIFLGGLLSNIDDTTAKTFSYSAFYNGSNKRISVRKPNGDEMTDEDIAWLNNVDKVVGVDKYDLASDMCYAYRKDIDYKKFYHTKEFFDDDSEKPTDSYIVFLNYNNYIMSSNLLNKDNLSCGELPKDINEVVISSNNKELLGTTIKFYLSCQKEWPKDKYIEKDMKVVGLVNSNSGQVYFSDKLTGMMAATAYQKERYFCYVNKYRRKAEGVVNYSINDELEGTDAKLSYKMYNIIGYIPTNRSSMAIKSNIMKNDPYFKTSCIDLNILDSFKRTSETSLDVDYDVFNESSATIIEVNSETFYKMYKDIAEQVTVYIEDYAYADKVYDTIIQKGYEAVIPYKMGSINYSKEKVRARLVTLLISFSALLIIFFLEVLIIKSLLKYKKGDFVIFKLIGMNNKIVSYINYFELLVYQLFAIVCSMVIVWILCLNNVTYIINIFKYYKLSHYIIYVVLNVLVLLILGNSYNKYLKKNFSITSLSDN
ncbi:ABC transporter ATP-binding protein [Sedimentibacter sp. zth1]|uniref:ABC transporter ATP-binding protein n=1 Tax=Sedimentibacter sp. zth1 TaxID=2816908 RepID=UPI001A92487A|nr:ABC transporter ATP-binding protein [Sedimentibacter sp. zth1]QSX04936.1 ABC transporter ATP-binding protein [Sedimentibacter sp. zth1]